MAQGKACDEAGGSRRQVATRSFHFLPIGSRELQLLCVCIALGINQKFIRFRQIKIEI